MSRRRGAVAAAGALLLAVVALGGCGGGNGDSGGVRLDGSPRRPDAQGILTEVDLDKLEITIDGDRTYTVADDLQSFSTFDLRGLPLVQQKRKYVHLGIDGETVDWIAGISIPVPMAEKSVAIYIGVLKQTTGRELVFRDGTVLELADGVTAPARTGQMQAQIDVESDLVVKLTPA